MGNGDPAYMGSDHPKDKDCKEFQIPAFNGCAQVIVQSTKDAGTIKVVCEGKGMEEGRVEVKSD